MATSGTSLYWQKKTKIKNIYPYLTDDICCDVVVIGGGISGALTSYFLAKEGISVVVVEKNIIGFGNTMSALALLDCNLDINLYKLERVMSKEKSQKIYKLCSKALDMIEKINNELNSDTEFKRQDSIYFTNKFMQKANMSKEFKARKEAGLESNLINSHSMLNINSGIFTKDASIVFNPYKFTQELFEYLNTNYNVEIFENTSVERVKSHQYGVECKTNNNFKIKASSLIFTSGLDTLKYFDDNNIIELYKNFTIVSSPLIDKEHLKNRSVNFTARDSIDPNHYLRFDNEGRIIFSGENTRYTQKFLDKKYLKHVSEDKYKKLINYLDKLFNSEYEIPIDYTYSSTYVGTKDNLSIIDELPNMANCFCNLGFGSNGILYSVLGASMLKNAINGLYTKDMNFFKINR